MMKILYRLIYSIVFTLFVFYEIVKEYWYIFKKHGNSITSKHFEENTLNYLKKKPKHISFIIDEEPSYKDLANLVLWCLIARISFVSFYDYRGNLEKNVERLEAEIDKLKQKNDDLIIWHNETGDFKNGVLGRKVHLKIITKEDGKYNIERVCRELINKKENIANINLELIDQCLKKQYGFPDPEVGVIFSEIFSLFGYPPWEIRLTEFFRLKSHHNIVFSDFVQFLDKYSKCNQRLGT